MRIILGLVLITLPFYSCSKSEDTTTGSSTAVVYVDMSTTHGTYRDVVGINKVPRGTDAQGFGSHTYDLAELYKAFGVSTVRALDSFFDVCEIYTDDTMINAADSSTLTNCINTQGTHSVWSANSGGANVNNSGSYSFTTVDNGLTSLYNSGAGLYLRLGENNDGPNDTTDFTNWMTVAKNLYLHVSGVSGGFGGVPAHTVPPLYIEVSNEPDGGFWMGTKADFFTLYNTTWDAIDAIAPSNVKIGGAGFTTTFEDHLSITTNVAATFVTTVTPARLDFFSAHIYGSCDTTTLDEMATHLSYLRTYMNANSLSTKPLIISEWNLGLSCSSETPFHEARAQSFNAAFMSFMQDTSLDVEKAMYYGGFGQMSFFTLDSSNPGPVTVYPGAWALYAHAQLVGGTLLDSQVCTASNTCLAGIATSGAAVQVTSALVSSKVKTVLSNDSSSTVITSLQIQNWTGSSSPTVTAYTFPSTSKTVTATLAVGVYSVSSTNASSLISSSVTSTTQASAVVSGTLSSTISVPAHSAVLVQAE